MHEIGHDIDHQALDQKGEFASETSPLLEVWRKIVLATATVKKLKLAAAGRKVDSKFAPGFPADYAELLPIRELWARAYAQFIVQRSANPALKAQFDLARVRMLWGYGIGTKMSLKPSPWPSPPS